MQKYNVPVIAHTAAGDLLGLNPSTGDSYFEQGLGMDLNLARYLTHFQMDLGYLINREEFTRKANGVPAYSPYG